MEQTGFYRVLAPARFGGSHHNPSSSSAIALPLSMHYLVPAPVRIAEFSQLDGILIATEPWDALQLFVLVDDVSILIDPERSGRFAVQTWQRHNSRISIIVWIFGHSTLRIPTEEHRVNK